MKIYASRAAFSFTRDVIGSKRTYNVVEKFVVIVLRRIMNPSFVSLDMFSVLLVHNNDDCLVHQLAALMSFMSMMLYKRHDMG